jgi:hypothetical protein
VIALVNYFVEVMIFRLCLAGSPDQVTAQTSEAHDRSVLVGTGHADNRGLAQPGSPRASWSHPSRLPVVAIGLGANCHPAPESAQRTQASHGVETRQEPPFDPLENTIAGSDAFPAGSPVGRSLRNFAVPGSTADD